jgi:PAS domain-containing protein
VNEEFGRIWGGIWSATEVADYVHYKAWWPDTGELVKPEEWASARAVRKGETIRDQVMQIERFDGKRTFIHSCAAPICDAAGRVTGAVIVIKDVTPFREADEALRQSEARLAEAERLANLGSWDWDIASGRLVWSEQTFQVADFCQCRLEPRIHPSVEQLHVRFPACEIRV